MNKTHFRFGAHAFVGILLLTSSVRAATLEALWNFDETTGGTFADSSGNGRNGTIEGTVDLNLESAIPGVPIVGRSAEFNGGTSSANVGTFFNSLTTNFAVAGWVHPDTVAGVQRIIASDRANGSSGWAFGTNGSSLRFTTLGVLDYNSAAGNLLPQTWKHIAVNFDSSNDATFYVNGVSIGTVAGTNPAILGTNNFYIARSGVTGTIMTPNGAPADNYSGRLDGLRVYSGTLTPTEIETLATVPNLQGYYAADELTGTTTAGDSSGFHATSPNRNGTIQTGVVLGQAAPKERFGTSMLFPGNVGTSRVDMTGTTAFGQLSGSFTVAAWIRPTDLTAGDQRVFSSQVGSGWGFGLSDHTDGGTAADDLIFTTYGRQDYRIDASLMQGEWAHVAVVYDLLNDAQGDVSFYVNGVLLGTVEGTVGAMIPTTNVFSMGVLPLTGQFFRGGIDELRVYDRILTQSEINALIPEPSSLAMMLFGSVLLLLLRGKRAGK